MMEFSCRNCSPLTTPDNCYESLLSTKSMRLAQYTGQIVSIRILVPLQIISDVPVFVPGEHQAKARGDTRRHSVERDNIIIFELLDQNCFPAESLCHTLIQRRKKTHPRISQCTYTFNCLWKRIVSAHPEDFERHLLPFVLPLPNFGRRGDMLGTPPPLHNTLKFIGCRDRAPVTA